MTELLGATIATAIVAAVAHHAGILPSIIATLIGG